MLDIVQSLSPYWTVIILPFLILVAPKLIRYVVSILLKYRRRSDKTTLQTQIMEYRKEMATISQTDEFAKYSKVQRKLRATTDQLNSIARQDLELNVQYVLIAQALAWLIAFVFFLRLLYQLYVFIINFVTTA